MIVRILGEGQFLLPEDSLDDINQLDAAVEVALDSGEEPAFRAALDALLARVRQVGTPTDDESLEVSDVVLPFADASQEDVRDLLGEEGLIPG